MFGVIVSVGLKKKKKKALKDFVRVRVHLSTLTTPLLAVKCFSN